MSAVFGDLETDGDFVVFDVDGDVVMSQDVGDISVSGLRVALGLMEAVMTRKVHCHGTQGSTPMSCASEPRG